MAYPVVVWVVPRRAGKSLAQLVRLLDGALVGSRRRGWYAPHRREVGSALWRDEWFPLVQTSRLSPLVQVRRSNGSETMTVRRLGSTVRLFAPDGQALRSQNADVVVVDEAREFSLELGERLEAAVRPAQARRPGRQLVIVSSAGGIDSTWLARYRDLGRAAVEAGERSGIAYLEYAAPEDLPWDDPATWRLAHPSVADGTIPAEALAVDAATMDPAQFQAEYLGWWHAPATRGVDLARWGAGEDPDAVMPARGRWIVAEVTPDRTWGAVAVAAPVGDGRVHAELVAAGPGATWVVDHVVQLVARGDRVRGDTYGPAGNITAELLSRLGSRVEPASTSDVARACAQLHDLVSAGRVRHRAQPELDDVIAGATARRHGDGWLWDRARTGPEVLAVTLAVDAAARPTAAVKPGVASR